MIGFYADDYIQMAILERTLPSVSRIPLLDLYRFIPADRAILAEMTERGPAPWFHDPALMIHFFRPLSSALLVGEHALWGRWATGYHLTTVLLYAALTFAAGSLYRTLCRDREGGGPVTASLAALCFAVASCHAQPAGWTAARHLLVAALPAVLALIAHVRHVRDGSRAGAILAPLALVVSLLASEAAIGGILYWLAFDALGPAPAHRAGLWGRLRASLPALAVGAVYSLGYKAFGYGAIGTDAYLDPVANPVGFAIGALTRVPALVAEAFTTFPSDTYAVLPAAPFVAAGLLATLVMAGLTRLVLPAIPAEERAALRWLLPGAFASLVLASGGFPGGRLLFFPSLGVAFFVAVLLHRSLFIPSGGRALIAGRVFLVAVHLVLGPLAIVGGAFATAGLARRTFHAYETAELDGPLPHHVTLIACSDPFAAFYPALIGAFLRPEAAGSWLVLSTAKHDHRVTRTAPHRLRIDVLGGALMEGAFDKNFRSLRTPFHAGDRVPLLGVAVTVLTLEGGLPKAIEAELDVPADDPSLLLLVWQGGRLARFPPPPVGSSVDLRWEPGPAQLF